MRPDEHVVVVNVGLPLSVGRRFRRLGLGLGSLSYRSQQIGAGAEADLSLAAILCLSLRLLRLGLRCLHGRSTTLARSALASLPLGGENHWLDGLRRGFKRQSAETAAVLFPVVELRSATAS